MPTPNHGVEAVAICRKDGEAWKQAREKAGYKIEEVARALGGCFMMTRIYDIEKGYDHATVSEAQFLEMLYARRKPREVA